MNIEEAILYLEHTGEDDFNLEDWQAGNRIEAIETLINEYNNLKQIEEAHRVENGKLREKINLLENEIERLKQTFVIQDDIDNHIPHID